MADITVGGESSPVTVPNQLPPAAAARAAAKLLKRHSPHEIAEAIEVLVDVLDLIGGDPDLEDATGAEDAFEDHNEQFGYDGPGCPTADPGGCEHNGCEPDHDAERETWSSWMDHPPELHIGKRPGWNDGPEAA